MGRINAYGILRKMVLCAYMCVRIILCVALFTIWATIIMLLAFICFVPFLMMLLIDNKTDDDFISDFNYHLKAVWNCMSYPLKWLNEN